jgi:hypothetical protein
LLLSSSSNSFESISCIGIRCCSRARLPRKSAWVGCRKVRGKLDDLMQKMTMLVKSPTVDEVAGSGGASRKIRQVGNIVLIVRITSRADGRRRSPA